MKKTAIARALGFPSLILLGFILCQGWSLEEDDFTILAADMKVIPFRKIAAAPALGFGGRKMMTAKVYEETLTGGFLDQKKHKNIFAPKLPMKKKKLLEDSSLEEEIVNLMRKDYGQGPPKPKRKPPINNHEPFH